MITCICGLGEGATHTRIASGTPCLLAAVVVVVMVVDAAELLLDVKDCC